MTQSVEDHPTPTATPPATPVPRRRQPMWRSPWTLTVAVVIIATLVYILPPYLSLDPAQARNTFLPGFAAHYALILVHVFSGTIAWVAGILQIWPWLLRRHRKVHRISGRLYVFAGVIPTTIMAIVLRTVASYRDHAVQQGAIGLYIAAAAWLVTTLIGYRRARQGRYADHRTWMTYSVALALTTLWNRPLALLTLAIYPPAITVMLEVIGWLPLIVHIAVAHWWLTRRRPAAGAARDAGRSGAVRVGATPTPT